MKVILPGSYDPPTLGHFDVIRRAAETYDEVYAVVFQNPDKACTFSVEDRVRMLMLLTDELDNVLVSYSTGYVIDYMRDHGIDKIVKGVRNDADLAYEQVQADWNLAHGGYETEYLIASPELTDVSSTLVRQRLSRGESVCGLAGEKVEEFLRGIDKRDF